MSNSNCGSNTLAELEEDCFPPYPRKNSAAKVGQMFLVCHHWNQRFLAKARCAVRGTGLGQTLVIFCNRDGTCRFSKQADDHSEVVDLSSVV